MLLLVRFFKCMLTIQEPGFKLGITRHSNHGRVTSIVLWFHYNIISLSRPFTFVILCTCMVLSGGISTVFVSFTVPSTLSREKVFTDTSPAQAIYLVNNDTGLLHFHFVLNWFISLLLFKSKALSMCSVTNCIDTSFFCITIIALLKFMYCVCILY